MGNSFGVNFYFLNCHNLFEIAVSPLLPLKEEKTIERFPIKITGNKSKKIHMKPNIFNNIKCLRYQL